MRADEYKRIYSGLNTVSDIHRLAEQTGLSHETLFVIYTQRTVRQATRDFYRVQHRMPQLMRKWKEGHSLVELAAENEFPPVLLAFMLCKADGVPRKQFWAWCRDPNTCSKERMRNELIKVLAKDKIYSPEGSAIQAERGKAGEARINEWLAARGLTFKTENDLKAAGSKTPDFLLDKPMKYMGQKVCWIESKASFGDAVEVRKNMKKQLLAYRELFGPGMVIYWFGTVDDIQQEKDIIVATGSVLANWSDDGPAPAAAHSGAPCSNE